jgi:omega-6 fatty acid desaturase (delta-12 desaturase)
MMAKRQFTAPLASGDEQLWTRILARYRVPNHGRTVFEIVVTLVPFTALWMSAWAAVHFGHWELSLLLAVPTSAFLMRLFMIQHDCGHGCFFRYRLANDWTGRVLSVLTLTPYDDWRRAHAAHHSNSGHLDRRGIGNVGTVMVEFWR